MATVDDESIARKLQSVSNAQDSIQSLSLWIIHHKNQHKRIVELWLKVLRKAKVNHRLTLFYLCNDVVQNCKRKQAVTYLASFQAVLKEAVRHVRDAGIRPKIERIFNIWEERSVYSSDFIADLKELITSSPKSSAERDSKAAPSYKPSPMAATNSSSSATASSSASSSKPATDPKPVVDPKLVADFKPMELRDKIQELSVLEMEVELKRNQLQLCKLDLTNTEAVRQLKDRAHGKEFSRQVEESSSRLEEYVLSLGRLAQARKSLKQILQVSSVFYAEQFHEVKIVAHAYKNFGSRVGNVKKKLGELVQSLPDPLSPIPSPNVDAPSPGNTPPLEPDKDTETVDMELSEEEEPAETIISPPAGRVAFTTTTKSISKPIASIREFRVEGTSEQAVEEAVEDKHKGRHHHSHHSKRKSSPEDSLEKRIADMLPNLPGEARKEKEHRHRRKSRDDKGGHKMKSVVAKVIYNSPKASQQYSPLEEGGGTPLADERPSTPVQDEKSPAASASQKVNPIDFLSQLISNTQKSGVASATNSSFLTQLTSTMGASREQQNGVEEDPAASGPQNWSSWKRDNQPELPPPPVSMTLPPRPILPPSGMVLPPTMRPVMGVAPPSPELLPPPAPPANFGGPPPRGPGLGMPPRFPDFSQPPPAPFFPQTSPGQKENWPLTGTGPPTSLPTPMQSVPIILGSNHPPPRSSPSDISPRGMLSPQGTTSPPAFPPPPSSAKPIKGILRNTSHHSVLKEVPLLPSQDEASGSHSLPPSSTSPPGSAPKPPTLPPTSAEMHSRQQFSDGAGPSSDSDADFLEFSEKLKRKTAVGSGVPVPQLSRPSFRVNPRNPNLMTLTPDPNPEESGELDMELDIDRNGGDDDEDDGLKDDGDGEAAEDSSEGEIKDTEDEDVIRPIATLGSGPVLRGGGRNSHGGKSLPSAVVPVVNQHPSNPSVPPYGQNAPPPREYMDSRLFQGRREDNSSFRGFPSHPPRDPYYQGFPGGRGPQYSPYRPDGRPPQYFPQRHQYASREYDNRYYRR